MNKQKTVKKIINFLKKEFKKRKKKTVVLALSGGIDSTLCAYLCKKAGLDLCAVILPYKKSGAEGEKLAKTLKLSKSRIITVNIAPLVDAAVKSLRKTGRIGQIDRGNIMARQRMVIQYALARRLKGLVVGTENLSEYYLGYFTLFGDQACDISPISGLLKTQVFELARYLEVPDWILKKAPTAGLWGGQTDEGELGFTYKEADQVIQSAIIEKQPKGKLIKKGLQPKVIDKVLKRIKETEYKREGAPRCL